jgi:hypothetical protein
MEFVWVREDAVSRSVIVNTQGLMGIYVRFESSVRHGNEFLIARIDFDLHPAVEDCVKIWYDY